MTSTPPLIQGKTLTYQESGQPAYLLVDTPDWYAWLSTASIFTFHNEHGTFMARKERAGSRRGGEYWKAYRRRQGKLYRVYLGKSGEQNLLLLKEDLYAFDALLADYPSDPHLGHESSRSHRSSASFIHSGTLSLSIPDWGFSCV